MEKQELLNKISTLANSIDTLVRAKQEESIKKVVDKMIQLIEEL